MLLQLHIKQLQLLLVILALLLLFSQLNSALYIKLTVLNHQQEVIVKIMLLLKTLQQRVQRLMMIPSIMLFSIKLQSLQQHDVISCQNL